MKEGNSAQLLKKILSKSDEKNETFSKICSTGFRYFLHGKGKGFALCMVKDLHCMVKDLHCTVTAVREFKNLENIFEKTFNFFSSDFDVIFFKKLR